MVIIITYTVDQVITSLEANPQYNIRKANRMYLTNEDAITYLRENASEVLLGANLKNNEYGHPLFADYFFLLQDFMVFMYSQV
jgi:cytochrome c oxidase subunit 3